MADNRKRESVKEKVNLTPGRISDFTCPPDKEAVFLWDDDVQGFGVKANRGGRKSYIYQDRLPGIGKSGSSGSLRISLGNVKSVFLGDARREAKILAGKVAKGIDPRRERAEKIAAEIAEKAAAAKQAATMADAWPDYIEANRFRWGDRHLEEALRMVDPGGRQAKCKGKGGKVRKIKPGILSNFMSLRLTNITPEAVQAWLETEAAARPAYARLAFSHLRAFLNWCAVHPDYSDSVHPDACNTRIKRLHLPPPKAKNDCLQKEQLKAWFEQVRKLDRTIAAYLQGLLLTGARRNELASLRWENVDFKWRSITIHDKVEDERTIPLTPYLASLLYSLPRTVKRGGKKDGRIVRSDFVFASPTAASGHIAEPRIAHNRATAAAGIEGLTIHGLRRSFGTLSEWVEAPVGVVAQIMGHKPSAIAEKHYRHRPLDLLRKWHVKIEGWILEQAGMPQPDENAELGKLRAVK
jgi:integrase